MANYIPKIAELLGVEIGEVFQIPPLKCCFFRFTDEFLQVSTKNEDNNDWVIANDNKLHSLLNGHLSIRKLPWKPTNGEKYYFSSISNVDLWDCHCWDNDECDEELYKRRIVLKTKEEAAAAAKKMLAAVQK